MAEIIEDEQRVAPGGAGGGLVADSLMIIADVQEELGFGEAAAGPPDQAQGGSVAVAGLLVVAELLMCVADGVQYRGLVVLDAKLAELAEGLLAICKSLLIVA
jgi:hypothetical protein